MTTTKAKAVPAGTGTASSTAFAAGYSIKNLLARLDKVRRTGPGTWQACCPSHDDRGPSLSIRETVDGWVLVKCFSGCETQAVLAAVGLTFSEIDRERLMLAASRIQAALIASGVAHG